MSGSAAHHTHILHDAAATIMAAALCALQDKQDNITNSACQEEVFYYQLMEVTDFRNDVILAEACRADVEKYCKDVEPGGCGCRGGLGRVSGSVLGRGIGRAGQDGHGVRQDCGSG